MKFIRFEYEGTVGYGVMDGNDRVRVYKGDMFGECTETDVTVGLADIKLLPPTSPGAMIALWNNSKQQIAKLNRETPKEALWFLKPASSFITSGDAIVIPSGEAERVVLEGELGIVIGRRCKGVTEREARECIFGYTVINDVTAQDVVGRDATFPQYTRGKGYDTFSVYGPCVETEVDPLTLRIQSYINGDRCQDYPVTDLAFNPYQIVAEVSRTMTLRPGDVIACGTSLGVKPIHPGDSVEIRIPGIGSLVNSVA
jgi:2-keto-4-pentenoate hydratase/2-oxohepta-3-ene-1,7-dioic acid hydratase in catechol pathway